MLDLHSMFETELCIKTFLSCANVFHDRRSPWVFSEADVGFGTMDSEVAEQKHTDEFWCVGAEKYWTLDSEVADQQHTNKSGHVGTKKDTVRWILKWQQRDIGRWISGYITRWLQRNTGCWILRWLQRIIVRTF